MSWAKQAEQQGDRESSPRAPRNDHGERRANFFDWFEGRSDGRFCASGRKAGPRCEDRDRLG